METRENTHVKPEFICDKCNFPMYTIEELGYLGDPNLENVDCSPFTELMTLCKECAPLDLIKPK